MSEPVWEQVARDDTRTETTFRLAVPGGWLYRVRDVGESGVAIALTFVPDAKL